MAKISGPGWDRRVSHGSCTEDPPGQRPAWDTVVKIIKCWIVKVKLITSYNDYYYCIVYIYIISEVRCILIYCDVYWDFLGIKGEVMSISDVKKSQWNRHFCCRAWNQPETSAAESSQLMAELWQSSAEFGAHGWYRESYPMFLTCLILFVLNIDSTVCEDNIHASHSTLLNSLYFF